MIVLDGLVLWQCIPLSKTKRLSKLSAVLWNNVKSIFLVCLLVLFLGFMGTNSLWSIWWSFNKLLVTCDEVKSKNFVIVSNMVSKVLGNSVFLLPFSQTQLVAGRMAYLFLASCFVHYRLTFVCPACCFLIAAIYSWFHFIVFLLKTIFLLQEP